MKLLKLGKQGCTPCKMVENYLQSNKVQYEDIDVFESPEIAAKFDIGSVPVVILLDEDGNEVERSAGFNLVALEQIISKL